MSKKYISNSFAILAASALIGASAQAEMNSTNNEQAVESQQESSHEMGMSKDKKEKMKEKMKEMHGQMHSESETEEQAASSDEVTTESEAATEIESDTETATTGEMDSTGGIAGETEGSTEAAGEISTSEPIQESPESTTAESTIETQPAEDSSVASMGREQIRSLQEKLNSEMSANLVTDGIFGPQTRQTLRQYQETNNLQVTGTPNQETISSLGISTDLETERRPASVPSQPSDSENLEMDSEMDTEMEQEQSSPVMENEDSSINSEQLNEEVD